MTKFEDSVRRYSKRGTQIRSAEGSAVGKSRAGAEDFKRLGEESTHRVAGPLWRRLFRSRAA